MDDVIQATLIGTVIKVIDPRREFPGGLFGDDIGLDVELQGGPITVGRQIILRTPPGSEELSVRGVETVGDINNPYIVRIHCDRPRLVPVEGEGVRNWTIVRS